MIADLCRSEIKQYKAMCDRKTAYVDSGANAHMVMDDSLLPMKMKLSNGSIGTASGEFERAKSGGRSEFQLS